MPSARGAGLARHEPDRDPRVDEEPPAVHVGGADGAGFAQRRGPGARLGHATFYFWHESC